MGSRKEMDLLQKKLRFSDATESPNAKFSNNRKKITNSFIQEAVIMKLCEALLIVANTQGTNQSDINTTAVDNDSKQTLTTEPSKSPNEEDTNYFQQERNILQEFSSFLKKIVKVPKAQEV